MLTVEGIERARQELLKIIPIVEWGDPQDKIMPEYAQNIFYMYGEEGAGWYRVTTDAHPVLNFEFMGSSFESAMAYAQALIEEIEER